MTNFYEFYEQAKSWAEKNTPYFSYREDSIENTIKVLEEYYNLPEKFFDKDDNYEKLYDELETLYILEQYINKGTIVL